MTDTDILDEMHEGLRQIRAEFHGALALINGQRVDYLALAISFARDDPARLAALSAVLELHAGQTMQCVGNA